MCQRYGVRAVRIFCGLLKGPVLLRVLLDYRVHPFNGYLCQEISVKPGWRRRGLLEKPFQRGLRQRRLLAEGRESKRNDEHKPVKHRIFLAQDPATLEHICRERRGSSRGSAEKGMTWAELCACLAVIPQSNSCMMRNKPLEFEWN